jgi:Xaa-Pro aminopeptidase
MSPFLPLLLSFALAPARQVAPLPPPSASGELAPSLHAERRARLIDQLDADTAALLFAAPVHNRNHDVDHPYRQGSSFWYLTGFPEPDAIALLDHGPEGDPRCTLFVPEFDPRKALWDGPALGVEGAAHLADEVRPRSAAESELKQRLARRKRVLVDWGGPAGKSVEGRAELLTKALPSGVNADQDALDSMIGKLRLVKWPEEIALLQKAIDVTCEAQRAAMRHAEPGMHEYDLQAVIEATYLMLGAPRIGFPSIVGAGPNSCILHYETNRAVIPPDRTIVVDIGAEFGMYAADVTRTLPSSGKFTPEQRIIYQAVLDAQKAGIAVAKPGATLRQIERAARVALGEALAKAGVVKDVKAAQGLLPHGTCHWLGLDVHDDCPYTGEGRVEVRLAPGMVTTVEPGCYIPAGAEGIDPKWHEIGVRIEDDVLITENGNVVLSAAAPREIAEVEAAMAEPSAFPRLTSSVAPPASGAPKQP